MQLNFKKARTNATNFVENKPFISFLILIAVIFGLILIGSNLNKPEETTTDNTPNAKEVTVFSIGTAPKISISGQIEKSGVIRIIAQSSGIIQKINVREGQTIDKGTNIASISTNYKGGTAETTQRYIAQKDYVYKKENLDAEKEIIELKRRQAKENAKNLEELRDISRNSEERTDEQIDLINEILDQVEAKIEELVKTNAGGVNDDAILQLKQTRLQLLSSNAQLKNSLALSKQTTNDDSKSEILGEISRDLTLKQLDLEEKSKELALETSRLSLQLSRIYEARMYPSTPISGTVERVFVKQGQAVNLGDTIAIITGSSNSATLVALVSTGIAEKISGLEESIIKTGDTEIALLPTYISNEPTDGTLHSIIYNIPEEYSDLFNNSSYIDIEVPIGYSDSISTFPFIPVDAVYQTQDSAYIYTVAMSEGNEIAEIRTIELGKVYGSYVEVKDGLSENDQVITNRNVVLNERIKIAGL